MWLGKDTVLVSLEVAAIVRRQSHSSFDRDFLHQVRGITRFGMLAIIRYCQQGSAQDVCHAMFRIRRVARLDRCAVQLHETAFLIYNK